jgi:hypothetical protein
MEPISDDTMRAVLDTAQPYTVVVLSKGPNYGSEAAKAIGWAHGKRNMQLRLAGTLNVVIPFTDDGDIRGIAVFRLPVEDVKRVLADDPALEAGVLLADYRSGLSFAGDALR